MNQRRATGRGGRREAGFTLLELIIVMAIIGILATIALPALKDMPRRATEAVLKTDLRSFRTTIDMHLGDKGYYPPSLEALVEEGYLRNIPIDPITKAADWVVVYEEVDPDAVPAETDGSEDDQPGIVDVRSASSALSLSGEPYSEW